MTDYCVGFVTRTQDKSTLNYALYPDFNQSKDALLGIMSVTGLELMSDGAPQAEVMALATATLELLEMKETDAVVRAMKGEVLSYETPHTLFFFKEGDGSDLKQLAEAEDDLKLEFVLLADHRKCTEDFCFSENSVNQN